MATAEAPEVVTVDGEDFYQWKVVLRIPKNWTPESGVFIAVAPPGGIANFPAAIQGKAGLPPTFRNKAVVPLAWDDQTEAGVEFTLITPATETVGPIYDVTFTLHEGEPGADGVMALLGASDLNPDDVELPTAGYIFQVNAAGDGVDLVAQKVGNTYWPTSVDTLSDATGANALTAVVVPSQLWPYRLSVQGQQIVSLDGPDVQVDLIARLGGTGTGDGQTDGHVIARGQGLPGSALLMQNLAFTPSPPVNSTAGFGEVSDGASRTVWIRVEQQGSGTDTFDTVSGRGLFSVTVDPLP